MVTGKKTLKEELESYHKLKAKLYEVEPKLRDDFPLLLFRSCPLIRWEQPNPWYDPAFYDWPLFLSELQWYLEALKLVDQQETVFSVDSPTLIDMVMAATKGLDKWGKKVIPIPAKWKKEFADYYVRKKNRANYTTELWSLIQVSTFSSSFSISFFFISFFSFSFFSFSFFSFLQTRTFE